MYTRIFVMLCIGILATACQKPASNAENLTPVAAHPFVPQRITGYVSNDAQLDVMKVLYKPGESDSCFSSTKPGEEDICFEWGGGAETSVNGTAWYYAHIIGNDEAASRHTQGKVRLVKFSLAEDIDNHTTLKKVEDSGSFSAGSGYGNAPTVKIMPISDNGELAWLVSGKHTINGRPRHVIDIFVSQNKKIVNIAMIDVAKENTDDSEDSDEGFKTRLFFKPTPSASRYHTIQAITTDGRKYELKYNPANNKYDIPAEYTGLFLTDQNTQL